MPMDFLNQLKHYSLNNPDIITTLVVGSYAEVPTPKAPTWISSSSPAISPA